MKKEYPLHYLEKTEIYGDKNQFIWHYTCNSPKQKILNKYKILSIGKMYGCKDAREVLLISRELYEKRFGKIKQSDPLTINCEILLRELDKKNK